MRAKLLKTKSKTQICSIALGLSLLISGVESLANSPTSGGGSAAQVQMIGGGSRTCGQVLQFFQGNDATAQLAFYSWAQGYASAASAVLGKTIFPNGKASMDFLDQQILRECQANPSMQFGHAVDKSLQRKLGQIRQ